MIPIRIIIWQHRPSPHQEALIRSLKIKCNVIWILEETDISSNRKKMGWQNSTLTPDHIVVSLKDALKFLEKNNLIGCHNLFNGTRSSQLLRSIYIHHLKQGESVFVQSEAYSYFGIKGWFRLIRGYSEALWEKKQVSGVFAIGSLGIKYYRLIGYQKTKIIPFGYFIDKPVGIIRKSTTILDYSSVNLIFVGRLVKTKGVDLMLKALSNIDANWKLNIIGNGPMKNIISKQINSDPCLKEKVVVYDFMGHDKVVEYIKNSDLLILPSIKKDGWGVVSNEALMQGVPVIASDKCGSSVLFNNSIRGDVVKAGSVFQLERALRERIKAGKLDHETKKIIRSWAIASISGEVAASYLIDRIKGRQIEAPWLN
jgi:glycosyltransferase involved in cell wall biosynthesis